MLPELMRQGIKASLLRNAGPVNPSARLDIDTNAVMARITFWNSGDVDLEVLEIESAHTLYAEQIHMTAPVDFDRQFRDFFAVIAVQGTRTAGVVAAFVDPAKSSTDSRPV